MFAVMIDESSPAWYFAMDTSRLFISHFVRLSEHKSIQSCDTLFARYECVSLIRILCEVHDVIDHSTLKFKQKQEHLSGSLRAGDCIFFANSGSSGTNDGINDAVYLS